MQHTTKKRGGGDVHRISPGLVPSPISDKIQFGKEKYKERNMLNGAPSEREWGMTLQMPAGGHLRNEGVRGRTSPPRKSLLVRGSSSRVP